MSQVSHPLPRGTSALSSQVHARGRDFVLYQGDSVALMNAGWGANGKLGLFGTFRAAAHLLSYEVPFGFAAIGPAMAAESLSTRQIVEAQAGVWFIVWQPLGFAIYLIAALMMSFRKPFDLPQAGSELGGGVLGEYSGGRLLVLRLALDARVAQDTATLARTLDAHLAFVQCQLLRATALDALHAGPESRLALADAIEYAYAQRAPRVLSDCGPQAQGLIYRALAGVETPQLSPTQRLWLSKHLSRPLRDLDAARLALSRREDAILRELCLGHSNKAIGRMLGMTENTVKFHLKCLYRKLGVRTRSGAVAALAATQSSAQDGLEAPYPIG